MESLSLTWSFLLDNKKVLVVGLTHTGNPVILLRTLDGKNEFFMILADWLLMVEKFPTLLQHFKPEPRSRKRKALELEEIKISGTHFDLTTKGLTLELTYKCNWLDVLLSRAPLKFSLSVSEVITMIKLQGQIQQSLDIIRRPPQTDQLVFTGNEENLEELLTFLVPKNNPPHQLTQDGI